jgi:hypothetical protein
MVHTQSNDLTTDFIIKEVMHSITAEDNKKNLQYICFNKVLQTKSTAANYLSFKRNQTPKMANQYVYQICNLQSTINNKKFQYTNLTLPQSSLQCIKTQFTHSHDQSASWQG